MNRPFLLSIAGIIGVGKTTLAHRLARELNCPLIIERYEGNPFLARQLAGDKEASLPSELFFLMQRVSQLLNSSFEDNTSTYITDYIYEKSRIFASLSLDDQDMKIFDRIENASSAHIAKPDLVIYLHDTVENCLERIASRGRDFETNINKHWLQNLADRYEKLFASLKAKVHRVDCSLVDTRCDEFITQIVDIIDHS